IALLTLLVSTIIATTGSFASDARDVNASETTARFWLDRALAEYRAAPPAERSGEFVGAAEQLGRMAEVAAHREPAAEVAKDFERQLSVPTEPSGDSHYKRFATAHCAADCYILAGQIEDAR